MEDALVPSKGTGADTGVKYEQTPRLDSMQDSCVKVVFEL